MQVTPRTTRWPSNRTQTRFRSGLWLPAGRTLPVRRKAEALKAAYQSPEVKAWFASYQKGILPTPWDQDPAADVSKL